MLGLADQEFADKLGMSDQLAERLLEGKSVPPPATRGRITEFVADEFAKRYKIKFQQQERQSE